MNAQTECPSWCDRGHLTDVSADKIHQGRLESVPVVALNRSLDDAGALVRAIEATEIVVFPYQYVGDDEVWIGVVEEERQGQRLEMSLESAKRLHRSLAALLERAG